LPSNIQEFGFIFAFETNLIISLLAWPCPITFHLRYLYILLSIAGPFRTIPLSAKGPRSDGLCKWLALTNIIKNGKFLNEQISKLVIGPTLRDRLLIKDLTLTICLTN
jgi:hypothetical protein